MGILWFWICILCQLITVTLKNLKLWEKRSKREKYVCGSPRGSLRGGAEGECARVAGQGAVAAGNPGLAAAWSRLEPRGAAEASPAPVQSGCAAPPPLGRPGTP